MPRTSRRADVRATAARLFREHGYSSASLVSELADFVMSGVALIPASA